MSDDDRIAGEAASWHIASAHDDMDWDGFTAWLEADPRHRQGYEEVALADALVADHRVQLFIANEPVERRPRPWAMGAMAATLAALLFVPALLRPSDTVADTIYAADGAPRAIALADGSQVELAPHSHLVLAGGSATRMRLDGGALFTIRHVAGRTLSIAAGPVEIRDIGTVFDVQADGNMVRVAIAEGRVTVASAGLVQPIALERGRNLLFDGVAGRAQLGQVDSATVGGWRHHAISYDDVPLALVVADLGRYANLHLGLASDVRDRHFSGTLIFGDAHKAARDLAQLMELDLVRDAGGDRLAARRR